MNERTTSDEVKAEGYMENGSARLRLRGNPSDPSIRDIMKRFPTFILTDEEEPEWQHSNLQVNEVLEYYQ